MIILNTTTFDGSTTTITGDKVAGNGYYGRSDGLHTVSWNLVGFTGTIKMQGSLSDEPEESDWFDIELGPLDSRFSVDTTGAAIKNNSSSIQYTSATTINASYNFTGNYTWVRIAIENFSAGTVSSAHMSN